MFRLAASYVDRILRGDNPSDLPVQATIRPRDGWMTWVETLSTAGSGWRLNVIGVVWTHTMPDAHASGLIAL
jgi:hypothetical protein